jgi:hypothetical protein
MTREREKRKMETSIDRREEKYYYYSWRLK